MVKLWFLFALEPTVVNALSLAKSEGEMISSVVLTTKRKVQLVFIKLQKTYKLQDCGDRPKIINGSYLQPAKNEAYIDLDQLEVQCRKR